MNILKNEKGEYYSMGDYIIGAIITIGFILLIIYSNGPRYGSCYEDQYGNERCYEDPRL